MTTAEIILRLAGAALIGGLVGLDREARGKPAGLRTNALVGLGAAIVTLTGIELASLGEVLNSDAVSRVIQGIVAGVGFLGGGAILKARDRDDVRGLTTAATIWVVAALGIACGSGFWAPALVGLALAIGVLILGRPVESFVRWMSERRRALKPPPPGSDED